MTEASGGSETWIYSLNKSTSPKGLLVTDSRTTNGINLSLVYQYNYDGSIGYVKYPSGRVVTYTYNSAAQATAAADNADSIPYVSNGHTFACDMLARGASIYDVAKMLADTVQTVERCYAQFLPAAKDAAQHRMDTGIGIEERAQLNQQSGEKVIELPNRNVG